MEEKENKEETRENSRIKGTVAWFASEKGYGFIIGDDTTEYFIHFSDIQGDGYRELFEGQKVTFVTAKDKQGRNKATNVRIIEKPKK